MLLREHTGYMDGFYGLPSGKVEYGEPFELGAAREVKEEVGVDITPDELQFVHVMHRHGSDGKVFMDWVDVYFEVSSWHGEPKNMEPTLHSGVEWIDLQALPVNVIPPVRAALELIASGIKYGEYGWDQ